MPWWWSKNLAYPERSDLLEGGERGVDGPSLLDLLDLRAEFVIKRWRYPTSVNSLFWVILFGSTD